MKDTLLFYYNETDTGIPDVFDEILELCLLNSHLFVNSFVLKSIARYYHDEFLKACSITEYQKQSVGILICGIALYFEALNDTYNSSMLFELASTSSNIVALVGSKKLCLLNDTMIDDYNKMKKICEDTIKPILYRNTNVSFVDLHKIFLNNILQHRDLLNNAIKNEKEAFHTFIECKNKTIATIREAIDLATCTFDFDIESFYNSEELDKLL